MPKGRRSTGGTRTGAHHCTGGVQGRNREREAVAKPRGEGRFRLQARYVKVAMCLIEHGAKGKAKSIGSNKRVWF